MKIHLSLSTKKLFIPIALAIVTFLFFMTKTDTYATAANFSAIFREMAAPLIISCAMCFVMAAGYIDLSVGAIAAFLSMLASRMLDLGLPILLIFLLMIVVGALCGLLNGTILHMFDLHPFVGTLAMCSVYRGMLYAISYRNADGSGYSVQITNSLLKMLNGGIKVGHFTLYYSFIVAIICVVICQILFSKTKFGINIYAMGSNLRAADLTGINTAKVQKCAYIACGILSAVCGIFLLSRTQTATTTMGTGLEFDAISALVVGGASAMGASETAGKASPVGAFFGALFLYMVYNGIYKLGINGSYQEIIQGAVLIIMLMVDGVVTIVRVRRQKEGRGLEPDSAIMEGASNG